MTTKFSFTRADLQKLGLTDQVQRVFSKLSAKPPLVDTHTVTDMKNADCSIQDVLDLLSAAAEHDPELSRRLRLWSVKSATDVLPHYLNFIAENPITTENGFTKIFKYNPALEDGRDDISGEFDANSPIGAINIARQFARGEVDESALCAARDTICGNTLYAADPRITAADWALRAAAATLSMPLDAKAVCHANLESNFSSLLGDEAKGDALYSWLQWHFDQLIDFLSENEPKVDSLNIRVAKPTFATYRITIDDLDDAIFGIWGDKADKHREISKSCPASWSRTSEHDRALRRLAVYGASKRIAFVLVSAAKVMDAYGEYKDAFRSKATDR